MCFVVLNDLSVWGWMMMMTGGFFEEEDIWGSNHFRMFSGCVSTSMLTS